jgi:cytochrome c5
MRHRYLLYPLSLLLLSSCAYDNAADIVKPRQACTTPSTVSYALHISPLLDRNCRSCHSATLLSGNVNLDNLAEIQTRARTGQLMGVVTHAPGFLQMPQGGAKLSDCDIALLQQWVTAGAPSN